MARVREHRGVAKVFVHGNPEVAAIWGPLLQALTERGVTDAAALSPPGFGAPVPAGFTATPEAYRDWLVEELERLGAPVDLVGHDWGAGHVAAVAAHRPDLLRTWAIDCAGLLHPDHEWHEHARAWRTPGVGEEAIGALVGMPTADLAAAFTANGVPAAIATEMAEAADEDLARCVLALYRGAGPEYLGGLRDRLAAAERRPALLVAALADPYVPASLTPEVAELVGAVVVEHPGGHNWMLEDPAPVADALVGFWA